MALKLRETTHCKPEFQQGYMVLLLKHTEEEIWETNKKQQRGWIRGDIAGDSTRNTLEVWCFMPEQGWPQRC